MSSRIEKFLTVRRLKRLYKKWHNNYVYYYRHRLYLEANTAEKACYSIWKEICRVGKTSIADNVSLKAYKDFEKKNLKLKKV